MLAIVAGAVIASLVAVTFELLAAKAAGPGHVWVHGVFAAVTVVGSWLLLPLLFALSYARRLLQQPRGATAACSFPGRPGTSSPTTPTSSTSPSPSP